MPFIEVKDADGKVIHTYEMVVAAYGTLVDDDDMFEMAKQNVIDDELVSEDQIETLSYSIAK